MLIRPPETLNGSYSGYSAIKRKIDSDYNSNISIWQMHWTEANIDTRLEAGDPTLAAQLNTGTVSNSRSEWFFNRTRPLCNSVSGLQRLNRKSTIVVPLENGDQKTSDQLTKVLLGVYDRENIDETFSDAFHEGACITGLNLLHVYLDWKNDPISGDIKVDNLSYNYFFIDPYFKKLDLSDCNFIWRRSYMTHSAAAAMIPDKYEEIMNLPGNPSGLGRDARFQYAAESYGQAQQNRVAYDEYYYRDYRKQKILADKVTGEILDVTFKDDIDTETFLNHYKQVELIEQYIPTVRLAIMIQDIVFYDGPQPTGIDDFCFIPVVGYYNSMMPYFYNRLQGICRSLRDPQMLLNRRIILSADLLESQLNSGWIFKENSVIDVKHLFQTGQGRIIPLKDSAQMADLQPITPPQIPPSFFQLQDSFSKEMNFVSGISEENMGVFVNSSANSSGYKESLRQSAGLTTLQPIFDRADLSLKLLGNTIMKIIQTNYVPGKIKNLLEGEEPEPLFYNKAFGKYHCSIQDGFNTKTQKQMEFAQLMQLTEMGLKLPPKTLINAATVQNKENLIKDIEQMQQQEQQAMQQQSQQAMQLQQAQVELAHARAKADIGLFQERTSRVEENRALAIQKLSEANKNDEQALLEKVKIFKELEMMDISHIREYVAISNELKAAEQATVQKPRPFMNNNQQNGSVG